MSKHLTHQQFIKQFLDDYISAGFKGPGYDSILVEIFRAHRREVEKHLEGCLTYLDESIAQGYDGKTVDFVGYQFHKGFRQWAPIDVPLQNSIAWTCISESDLFWEEFNAVCKLYDEGPAVIHKPVDTVPV